MKKSLFFIVKPLELLGAIEAVLQFNIKEPILVYSCKDGIDKKTIEYLIEKTPFEWNKIEFVKPKPYYGYFWVQLINELKSEPLAYLFTRGFSVSAYFIHNLDYEQHYLLDDGMATLIISKDFMETQNLTKRFSLFRGINKKGFKYSFITTLYRLFNIYLEKEIDTINLFTIYQLDNIGKQKVIKNQQKWVKSLKNKQQIHSNQNVVYFIGTDLVGANFLNETDYLITIEKILEYYPNKEMVYIPHPKEQDSFLEKLKVKNIRVKKNKLNIELDFLINNITPTHLAGTISTALITLKLMYGDDVNIDYFNLNESLLSEENKRSVTKIRAYQSQYLNELYLKY